MKRLATHGTGCRTNSEDACTSKSRGIVLREPKTPANTMTPQKPVFGAQRDASDAARRRWLGEAAQTWTYTGIIRHHTSNKLPWTLLKVLTAARDAAITL